MKKPELPEHLHPHLKMDNLDLVATVIAFVHDEALNDLHREKGDNRWVLGCMCYARFCETIRNLAKEKRFSWLTVADDSMHFVFRVGDVHFRACKGDEDGSPNSNSLTRVEEETELNPISYLPGFEAAYGDCVWRFVVIKGAHWQVDRVELQLVDSETGEWALKWPMPLASQIAGLLPWAGSAKYAKQPPADVKDPKFGDTKKDKRVGESG